MLRSHLRRLGWGALLPALAFVGWTAQRWLLAAGVFLRLEQRSEPAWLVHYGEHALVERELPAGRLYAPTDVARAPGIVLAHGMHEEGVREARLVRFARALAGAGFSVLTPRLLGLANYRIEHADVLRIAEASRALAARTGARQVPVFGVSFGGGLALRAACEPAQAGAIARVIGLGAHHDADRVSRFFLGEPARGPSGELAQVEPHPYGRVALWMSLFGERHRGAFSDQERARAVLGLEARREALAAASPRHCPGPVRVPVFLIHGTGDRVVPATETLWNEAQLRAQGSVRTLLSPAIVHAEYAPPSLRERLALVGFIVSALF